MPKARFAHNLLSDGVSLCLAKELLEALGSLGTGKGGVGDERLELGAFRSAEEGLDGLEVGLDLLECLGVF